VTLPRSPAGEAASPPAVPEEGPPAARPRRARERLAAAAPAALVALAVLACYANSLGVPFQFDDRVVILGEPTITTFHLTPASHRFLGDLSFAISYRLFGDRPTGYHVVNVAIHLANALLVLWLVGSLLRTERLRGALAPGRDRAVALLAALLFAVHPLQTQAVTYIAQRYASLAAGFFLLACGAYVRFRLSATRRAATGWYAGFLLATGAAFWTKENALVLPLAVLILELACFTASAARRVLYLSPFLTGAALSAVALVASGTSLAALDASTRLDTAMPRHEYALTQLRVVARYLQLLVLPVGQNIDHAVTLSRSLLEPRALAGAALHATLLFGAALAFARARRGAPLWRLVGLGVLWFYATLLVESSFIPIADLMYEHRVYLPSFGAFLAVAALLAGVPALSSRRAWTAATLALALPLAALTVARNRVWASELSLWADAAAKSPHKSRSLNNLGGALFQRGDPRGALAWYERALEADPDNLKVYFNAGEALQALGDCTRAIPAYERFLALRPEYPDTYLNLARCYEALGKPEIAASLRAAHDELVRRTGGVLPPELR
jgi:tetratricopeptide (TPR) repeat protein